VNSNPSRPGLREGGTDNLELFLSTRGSEVLTAYAAELKIAPTVLSQSLKGAKDAKFMAFWNADVSTTLRVSRSPAAQSRRRT
jgi:hypothetical protein